MGLKVALLEAQHGERDVRAVVGDALIGGDDRSARPLSRPSVFLASGTASFRHRFASAPASSGALAAVRPASLLYGPRHRRGEERPGREDREHKVLLYLRRGHCQTREVRHRQAPFQHCRGSKIQCLAVKSSPKQSRVHSICQFLRSLRFINRRV